MASKTEFYTDKIVTLELDTTGQSIKAETALNYASGCLKDFLATSANKEETLPIRSSQLYEPNIKDFELLNRFIKFADEHLHEELRQHADESDVWIEILDNNKAELLKLAENVSDETIICCMNMGDYLVIKPFVMFCSLILYERIHTLKLSELRKRFGEEDDFDAERRTLIKNLSEKL